MSYFHSFTLRAYKKRNFILNVNVKNLKKISNKFVFLEHLLRKSFITYTLKKCALLKIGNNSSSVKLTHFREKTHFLGHELIFISWSWRVYNHIKFSIWNKRLEWYKKRLIFAKLTLQMQAATHIKWKNQNNWTWVNFNSFTLIKSTFSSWIIFNLVF